MPATYLDQFFILDPYNPPPFGTPLAISKFNLVDQNDDNDFDRFNDDSIDGSDITASWPDDTVTVDVPGVGTVTYTGTTFYLADGRQVFTPNDGQTLEAGTLVSATGVTTQGPLTVPELGPPCFTRDTMIRTRHGERPVQDLKPGDLVVTRDSGLQPVVWIGRTIVRAAGDFAPIRFDSGALGNDRVLLVSPQHRVLIDDWRAAYYCGCSEVFAAAKHLVNATTVHRVPGGVVEYIHLLFARHEVVYSQGIPSESYYPEHAFKSADRAARAELRALFGDQAACGADDRLVARPVSHKREARMIALAA